MKGAQGMAEDPSDLRFQFETIRHLAESTRQLASNVSSLQGMAADIVERLARIEANEVNSRVKALELKVADLEGERNQRVGMQRVVEWIFKSPMVGWVIGAGATIWLILRRQ